MKRKAHNTVRVTVQVFVQHRVTVHAKVVVMTVAAEDVKVTAPMHAALVVAMIAQMGVSKGVVADAERIALSHVNWDVKKTVCLGAVWAVTISVLPDAEILAKQLAYKDVTMVAEILVVVAVPIVVHLVAVDCCTAVVALELDQGLPFNKFNSSVSVGKEHHFHCN